MYFEAKCFCGRVNKRKRITTMRCVLCFGMIAYDKWRRVEPNGRYRPIFYSDLRRR